MAMLVKLASEATHSLICAWLWSFSPMLSPCRTEVRSRFGLVPGWYDADPGRSEACPRLVRSRFGQIRAGTKQIRAGTRLVRSRTRRMRNRTRAIHGSRGCLHGRGWGGNPVVRGRSAFQVPLSFAGIAPFASRSHVWAQARMQCVAICNGTR